MTLKELGIGQKGIILSVGGSGALRQHFLDMGLIRGAEVTVVKYAPMGDPIELKIHGYELTIRLDDAEKIEVKEIKSEEKEKERRNVLHIPDTVKAESTIRKKQKIRLRMMRR